jgi:hypothetical protein
LLCVQCWTPDDGQRNCPKHVEFYSKNKFEELVHLVGFIIRIYHDAQSSECQIIKLLYWSNFAHNDNVLFSTDSDSGAVSLKRDLPHTITEWIGTTICVSSQLGLGIAPPTHITTFQPFFLDYTMPYSIKRGEVVQLKVSLFNFLSYNLPVCICLFRFISSESVVLLRN